MRRNWTSDDLTSFRRDFKRGDMSIEAMSAKYGRTVKALREKACVMKMARPSNKGRMRPWTDEEFQQARDMRNRGLAISTIAYKLKRSRDSIAGRLAVKSDTDGPGYWLTNRERHQRATKEFAEAMSGQRFDSYAVKSEPVLSNMRLARVREVSA